MFRNSLEGNRDFYLATARDGERFEIAKLGQGTWPLNACPWMAAGWVSSGVQWSRCGGARAIFSGASRRPPEERFAAGRNPAVALRKEGSTRCGLRRKASWPRRPTSLRTCYRSRRVSRGHRTGPGDRRVGRQREDRHPSPGSLTLGTMGHASRRERGRRGGDASRRVDRVLVPRRSYEVRQKQGSELVTTADLRSDEILREHLGACFPDHRFLSEEVAIDGTFDFSGPVWIIDPIDGTSNYAHGHPYVSISAALAVEGEPCVGVVHAPFSGRPTPP